MAITGARQDNQAEEVRLAFTCAGYGGITASECQQRGCCYVPVAPYVGSAVLELPVCVYPNAGASTYAMSGNMAATGAPARLSGGSLLCERGCLLGIFAGEALVRTPDAAGGFNEHHLVGGKWVVKLWCLVSPGWEVCMRGCASERTCTMRGRASSVTSTASLTRLVAGNGQQTVTLVQQSSTLPQLGPDVSPLTLTQESVRPDIMRVKIGAPGRWEVPRATFPANISTAGEQWASQHVVRAGRRVCMPCSHARSR